MAIIGFMASEEMSFENVDDDDGRTNDEDWFNDKLRFLAGLPRHKKNGNGQFNPITDRVTCHRLRARHEFSNVAL